MGAGGCRCEEVDKLPASQIAKTDTVWLAPTAENTAAVPEKKSSVPVSNCGGYKQEEEEEESIQSSVAENTIERYTGTWHREPDMLQMGDITADGTIKWAKNHTGDFTKLTVSLSGLQMLLHDTAYEGMRIQEEGGISRLRWSDGEVWVRGFERYIGIWHIASEPNYASKIDLYGNLRWDDAKHSKLQMHRTGVLVLATSRGPSHTGRLGEAHPAGDTSKPIVPALFWTDGDMWTKMIAW